MAKAPSKPDTMTAAEIAAADAKPPEAPAETVDAVAREAVDKLATQLGELAEIVRTETAKLAEMVGTIAKQQNDVACKLVTAEEHILAIEARPAVPAVLAAHSPSASIDSLGTIDDLPRA